MFPLAALTWLWYLAYSSKDKQTSSSSPEWMDDIERAYGTNRPLSDWRDRAAPRSNEEKSTLTFQIAILVIILIAFGFAVYFKR